MADPISQITERTGQHSWLRGNKKFPHLWCPGCGLGSILNTVIRVFLNKGYDKNNTVVISGIGCTGRIPVYLDCNTMHTTHGRALTFATGVKLAKPHLKVIVFMGDGDAVAIGGNHFIHAARRNIDITAVVVNNSTYGMTGGQHSPTTPLGMKAVTTVMGNIDPPFDICDLAIAAGATFVARSTAFHFQQTLKLFSDALDHKGFSVLEIVSHCHTSFGRINKLGSPLDMLKQQRDHAVLHSPELDAEKARAEGKDIVIGLLKRDTTRPEYCEQYEKLIIGNAQTVPSRRGA